MKSAHGGRLIVAVSSNLREKRTGEIVDALIRDVGVEIFKVTSRLLLREPGSVVDFIMQRGASVMIDNKSHEVPSEMAAFIHEAAKLRARIYTVHASAGREALLAVAEAKQAYETLKVFAITVLTSFDEKTCRTIYKRSIEETVLDFAQLAQEAGLDGVVCSGQENHLIRGNPLTHDLEILNPGIRDAGGNKHDQSRTVTTEEAILSGADYVVVGRPIMDAKDPIEEALRIFEKIANALAERRTHE